MTRDKNSLPRFHRRRMLDPAGMEQRVSIVRVCFLGSQRVPSKNAASASVVWRQFWRNVALAHICDVGTSNHPQSASLVSSKFLVGGGVSGGARMQSRART